MHPDSLIHYIIHVDDVELEHRAIFTLSNNIKAKLLAHEIEDVPALLAELKNLVVSHFKHEEEHMRSINFPYIPINPWRRYSPKESRITYTA